MLAYVFWHRRAAGVERGAYEDALRAFHASLRRRPPEGFAGSVTFATPDLPWSDAGYEDWYAIEDFTALGVLNEAARAAGHRSLHDRVAGLSGDGTGSIYALREGSARLAGESVAVWVDGGDGELADMLGDGLDPEAGGVWERQLALGPAPRHCVLAQAAPAGVAPSRLPEGWSALQSARAPL